MNCIMVHQVLLEFFFTNRRRTEAASCRQIQTQNGKNIFYVLICCSLCCCLSSQAEKNTPLQLFTQNIELLEENTNSLMLLKELQSNNLSEIEKRYKEEQLFRNFIASNGTSYIMGRDKIRFLVMALTCDNVEINKLAFKTLSERVRQIDLNDYSQELYQVLELNTFFAELSKGHNIRPIYADRLPLIGRLSNLTEEEKKTIFSSNMIDAYIKAKLGDQESEKMLIEKFVHEDDYNHKRTLAYQLGYIGSDNAIRALLKQLDSTVKLSWQYGEISIRGEIIKALHKALPDEKIFSVNLEQFAENKFSPLQEKKLLLVEYGNKVNLCVKDKTSSDKTREMMLY